MYVTIECARCHAAHYAPLLTCPFCKFGPVLPKAAKRPVAQQIALLLAVADLILLIPASIAMYWALLATGIDGGDILALIAGVCYAAGIWLLVNTQRYAKKRLAYGGPIVLWSCIVGLNVSGFIVSYQPPTSGVTMFYPMLMDTEARWVIGMWHFWSGWAAFWAAFALFCDLWDYRTATKLTHAK